MGKLTAKEVQDFLVADKVVARPRQVKWARISQDEMQASLHVEVDGEAVATLLLIVNVSVPSQDKFKLDLQGESVLMWHFRTVGKHRNNGCPDVFPARVNKSAHEHVWTEGRGVRCARPLERVDGLLGKERVELFCRRLSMDLQTIYVPPPAADQMVIPFEEEL